MKKVLFTVTMAAACAWAQEVVKQEADQQTEAQPIQQQQPAREAKAEKAAWPVWIAFNSTKNIDVVGFRLTIPYGACEGLTGFDLGLFGRCRYMEGFQLNILRNEAEDVMAGFQCGISLTIRRACSSNAGNRFILISGEVTLPSVSMDQMTVPSALSKATSRPP